MTRRALLAAAPAIAAAAPPTVGAPDPRDPAPLEFRRQGPWWISWTGFRESPNSLQRSGAWVAVPGMPVEARKWEPNPRSGFRLVQFVGDQVVSDSRVPYWHGQPPLVQVDLGCMPWRERV